MVRAGIGVAVTVWFLTGCASTMPASAPTNPMLSEAQQCMRGGAGGGKASGFVTGRERESNQGEEDSANHTR